MVEIVMARIHKVSRASCRCFDTDVLWTSVAKSMEEDENERQKAPGSVVGSS